MKPVREQIDSDKGGSFTAYRLQLPRFAFTWHYHPEWELTYILRGRGRRLVGDSYQPFGPGDMVLLGANLPHTWESEQEEAEGVEAIVVQFPAGLWERFALLPEFASVAQVLARADRGLQFPAVPGFLLRRFEVLPDLQGAKRMLALFDVLAELASVSGVSLSSDLYRPMLGDAPTDRINNVCRFIHQEAHRPLPLAEVAAVACLQPSAFCRFFKRATGKTYSDYLNEIRIARTCVSLHEGKDSVAAIAFKAGYENLSYFNRVFKKRMGTTPRRFGVAPELQR